MIASMTARHEAGHLVAAHILGLATTSATVVAKGQTLGTVRFKDTSAALAADPQRARKLIVATLAARAACRGYADPGDGCGSDDDQVWAAARRIVGDDPAHAAEVGLLVRECWDEAREIADDYGQAIGDVAGQLDLFGTLKGAGLARMVEHYVAQDRASPFTEAQRERRRAFRRWEEETKQGGSDGPG